MWLARSLVISRTEKECGCDQPLRQDDCLWCGEQDLLVPIVVADQDLHRADVVPHCDADPGLSQVQQIKLELRGIDRGRAAIRLAAAICLTPTKAVGQ
jgi:hypothetical protein